MAVDWVSLEIDYSLGEKSVEELSREYDVPVAHIEKRAIMKGWSCEGIHALTAYRQRFVEEYMVDFNGAAAGLRAGANDSRAGSRMLFIPEVRAAIAARMRELRHTTNVTQERIVAQMARIAFGDIRELYDEEGNLRPLHELSEDQVAMIEGIDVLEGKAEDGNKLLQTKRIKLAPKLQYLMQLGKFKGLFNDKIEVEAKIETKDVTPNDVARRLAFMLLSAAREQQASVIEAVPTKLINEKEQEP